MEMLLYFDVFFKYQWKMVKIAYFQHSKSHDHVIVSQNKK